MSSFSVGYSGRWSAGPIEINFEGGRLVFLVGPNGAGKSTFLKTMAGIIPPTQGSFQFNCRNVMDSSRLSERPAFLPAQSEIQWGLRGVDLMEIYELKNSQWFNLKTFEQLGVRDFLDKELGEISSGERQKILLATVLSHPSDLVLLDEPLSFLDWQSAHVLAKLIDLQKNRGRNFAVSTHDLQWVLNCKDSETFLIHGRGSSREWTLGLTQDVLVSKAMSQAFNFKSQLADNPIDKSKLLAIASLDE